MNFPDWTVAGGLKFHDKITGFLRRISEKYDRDRSYFISSVYGSPSKLRWQGGRQNPEPTADLDEAVEIIKTYNRQDIGFYFTFTNTQLREAHLRDQRCNRLLSRTENRLNGVVVGSEKLRRHVDKNYPEFNLKASICLGSRSYEKLLEHYRTVTLHPDDNRDYELIESLPAKDRLEVLVNERCASQCQFRQQHYRKISRRYLRQEFDKTDVCMAEGAGHTTRGELVLDLDELEKLRDLGINKFKIQGRSGTGRYIEGQMQRYVENYYRHRHRPED